MGAIGGVDEVAGHFVVFEGFCDAEGGGFVFVEG